MEILAPISVGELIDKITILRLKAERIADPARLANVSHELSRLEALTSDLPDTPEFAEVAARLQAVNAALWDIEDGKRRHEREARFDAAFVELARQVYLRNDERAALKRAINALLNSELIEEKSYACSDAVAVAQPGLIAEPAD